MHFLLSAAPLVAALFGIYLASIHGYLLFHSLAEGIAIVIACGVFMIAWNARRLLRNHYLLFIGIAYLFVAGIDFLHALAYKGMGVFEGHGANLPTQLWIAGRYLEAISLLLGVVFLRRRLFPRLTLFGYGISTGLLLVSIFHWKVFPDCYIEGAGLTPFKIYSEYTICMILIATIGLLVKNSQAFDRKVLVLLIASVATTIAQELAFTTYLNVYGPSNMVGHLLKIVSSYLIYKAIIETGLVSPWNLLFRDLKQAEEKLRKARDELEVRVRERTAELERVNRDLTDFNYIAAHDLQEPLRVLVTLGDRLAATLKESPEEARYIIGRMQNSARRASALIRDIHKYSIVSSCREPFNRTDLNSVVGKVLAEFEEEVEQKGAYVSVEDLPTLEVCALHVGEVFRNLLSNALKFTGDEKPRIRISAEAIGDGNQYRILVEDNGLGFDEAYLSKIFTPFQRLHGGNRFQGSGIGLALCRKVVERHGGSITAMSRPNHGSTFIITLPVSGNGDA